MDESLEDIAMSGDKIEKKARRLKEEKRENIRRLKKLANMDQWEDEDELAVADSQETLKKFLKFIKDPMIKKQFAAKDFRVLNNSLVDCVKVLEKLEMADEDKLLKKI